MDRQKPETQYTTQATNQPEFTNQTDKGFPNLKNISGDSVDEHRDLEVANVIFAGEEIKQQNENL